MITLEQAKNLKHGDILYHATNTNADGSPQRWRVNGKPKTWKRTPGKVQVPLKYGLWSYAYLTENDLNLVCLNEEGVEGEKEEEYDCAAVTSPVCDGQCDDCGKYNE